jgi:hypothetical protein
MVTGIETTETQPRPEIPIKPKYLHIVYTGPEQEAESYPPRYISFTMLLYANEQQIAALIQDLKQYGVGNQDGDAGSDNGIYITSSEGGLQPTSAVSIEEFADQRLIAANLAHASHVANAAVNTACTDMALAVSQGEMDSSLLFAAGNLTSPLFKSKLTEVFKLAYFEANRLLQENPSEVLANFDEQTRDYIQSQLNGSSLWSYISKVGIGLKSFTNAKSPSTLLNENKDLVPVIVGHIFAKANQNPHEFLEIFLNTPEQVLHALLQKAARGPNESIGADGDGLGSRLSVEVEDRAGGKVYRYQLDPAAQQEITEVIQAHNNSINGIIEIVRGPIAKYCYDNKIRLEVVPSHYLREHGICPVLGKAWISDDNPAISTLHNCPADGQPAAAPKKHPHHPGYERPQMAYMGQVELVYAVIRRLKELIDLKAGLGEV